MSKEREALKLALHVMRNQGDIGVDEWIATKKAIEEVLAQPEQEPVAWMDSDGNISDNNDHKCFPIPLYTTPPQRTWVGLTHEDMVALQKDLYDKNGEFVLPTTLAMAVEAKLKEKNT